MRTYTISMGRVVCLYFTHEDDLLAIDLSADEARNLAAALNRMAATIDNHNNDGDGE